MKPIESKVPEDNYALIKVSSSRPDITYASHCCEGGTKEYKNYLYFLTDSFNESEQPCVLIFLENKMRTIRLAHFLDNALPLEYRGKCVVLHYHSAMQSEYLEWAHNRFTQNDSKCKILVSTSAESTVSCYQFDV
jgi:superfamily II DNA helicase RecQ